MILKLLAFLMVMSSAGSALAQTRPTPLRDAARRAAVPTATTISAVSPRVVQSPGSWPARHPVLLGTLVGLGAGFSYGYATCKYPGVEGPCDYYTYPDRARTAGGLFMGAVGAGIGAGVGAVIAASRNP